MITKMKIQIIKSMMIMCMNTMNEKGVLQVEMMIVKCLF